MKTVNIYEVGETVLIKAKVTAIIPDKDRFVYELTADGETDKLKHRFQDKDITAVPENEYGDEDEQGEE